METKTYHEELQQRIDDYVDGVYHLTRDFPKEELFSSTSQLRRAALSVALNCVEGYARQRKAVMKNFFEIAYGSLKESQYLLDFALRQKYVTAAEQAKVLAIGHQVGKMLWGILRKLD